MFRLLLASTLVVTSSIANAQIEEEKCHAEKGDKPSYDTALWSGDYRMLRNQFNWHSINPEGYWGDVENYMRLSNYGNIGVCGRSRCGDATTDAQVCWSLSPFTTTNTNNGETCTHDNPDEGLEFTTSTKYYRMQIDRSQTPTRYCQIEITTADAPASGDEPDDGIGNTCVVTLDANGNSCSIVPDPDGDGGDLVGGGVGSGGGGGGGNGQGRQATPVPTMPMYLLMGLSGLLALFGFYRASK